MFFNEKPNKHGHKISVEMIARFEHSFFASTFTVSSTIPIQAKKTKNKKTTTSAMLRACARIEYFFVNFNSFSSMYVQTVTMVIFIKHIT